MSEQRMYRGKVESDDPAVSKRWAYGDKCTVGGRVFIVLDDATIEDVDGEDMMQGFVEVIPSSVGQSTGVKGKDGVEIYGGNLVQGDWQADRRRTVLGIVTYYDEYALWALKDEDGVMVSVVWKECIVIGNATRR